MVKDNRVNFFQIGSITWILLLGLAFVSRSAFILKTHIVFTSDEAGCLSRALHFGSQEWQDRSYPSPRMFDGLRYWIAIAFYHISNGWLRAGALEAILFNLTGCALWVYWAYRRLSPKAAFITAIFLSIPPACLDYYATLMERRQVSFVLGAIFAVGWEKWFSNFRYSFLFGLLLGWGFWEDPFVLAFVVSLFLGIFWRSKWKPGVWKPAMLGILISGIYGLYQEWQDPQYAPGYLTFGITTFSAFLYRIHLLTEAFPQFWNDNMPTGYLQSSLLGQAIDPVEGGIAAVFFRVWTGILLATALTGYSVAALGRRKEKPLVLAALTPMVLLLLFFLLSDHVWDALCFRYFTYWPVGVALGLGFLVETIPDNRKAIFGIFLAFLMLTQSIIFFHRIYKIPRIHPAERVISTLDEMGLKAGWANGWVSGIVNFLSQDRICLNQYNFKPCDRKAEWLSYHSPRIAVVSVDGLDQPQLIQKLLNGLEELGYHPFGRWNFNEGWSVIELRKGSVEDKLSLKNRLN